MRAVMTRLYLAATLALLPGVGWGQGCTGCWTTVPTYGQTWQYPTINWSSSSSVGGPAVPSHYSDLQDLQMAMSACNSHRLKTEAGLYKDEGYEPEWKDCETVKQRYFIEWKKTQADDEARAAAKAAARQAEKDRADHEVVAKALGEDK